MVEIDVSDKARFAIKYGFAALFALALASAGAAWLYRSGTTSIRTEARVTGDLVGAKARVAGVVSKILANDGDTVRQGQTVAKIKVKVSAEHIRQLEKAFELSKRNLAEIEAGTSAPRRPAEGGDRKTAEQARADLERMQRLYEIGAVSAKQRDDAEAEYREAASRRTEILPSSPQAIEAARRQVRQAEAALNAAAYESAATEIYAPVAGTVYMSDVHEGSEVRPGQTILSVGDGKNIWLEAYLDPSHEGGIKLGEPVSYTVNGKDLYGTVTEIVPPELAAEEPEGKGTEGSRPQEPGDGKLKVKISIPPEAAGIRPGATTTVSIPIDR